MNLQKLIGYLSTGLGGAIGAIVGKQAGPEIGAYAAGAAGAIVSLIGGRLLHRLPPPPAKDAK